jgi:nucleotide-binding universal stress UspA family protein
MYKRILLATDGSKLSDKAVQTAMELTQIFSADLVVVKVVPHYIQTYFEGSFAINDVDVKNIESQWETAAQKTLDEVQVLALAKGLHIHTRVVKSDDIAQGLIDTAKQLNSELIVMASHGRKGIKRLLLGSETTSVLTHATIPVLVLR